MEEWEVSNMDDCICAGCVAKVVSICNAPDRYSPGIRWEIKQVCSSEALFTTNSVFR